MINEKEKLIGTLNNAIYYVDSKNQEKEANPLKIRQVITPDKPFTGLSKVTINPVTNEIDNNIISSNIKNGVEILGVTGNVIELKGEELNVTPNKQNQSFTPSNGKNGFTNVEVSKIPDEYIMPSGEIEITSNGIYDVTNKSSANVNVPNPKIDLGSKIITANGKYNASDDNLDGYSKVEVATSGGADLYEYFIEPVRQYASATTGALANSIKKLPHFIYENLDGKTNYASTFQYAGNLQEIEQFDTSKGTSFAFFLRECSSIEEIPLLDTSNGTTMASMFYKCSSLKSIPNLNTSKCTNFNAMLQNCSNLESLPKLDCSKMTNISNMFYSNDKLTTLGGFESLGQAYTTTAGANSTSYTLNLSTVRNLTHDSLMNVINNLYDIGAKGCKTQTLQLGATNRAKLTDEEIAIAQNKGWTVS